MIFKTYSSESVARVFFNGYLAWNMLLGFIALYGFVSGAGILSTLSGFMFIVLVSLLSRHKKFRKSSFSIPLCFFSLLYLNIPIAFILFEGSDYIFGVGVSSITYTQSDYQQSLPLGFLYLSVLWFAMWFGVISVNIKVHVIDNKVFSSNRLMYIALLGAIVFIVAWFESQSYVDVRVKDMEKANSLLVFIMFDNAYVVMAGLILFFKLNEPRHILNPRKINTLIFLIFIVFIALDFIDGSKGAILEIFMLFMLLPLSAFREYPRARVSFPSIKFLMILVFVAPILFYLASIQRDSLGAGIAPDLSTLLAGISEFDASVFYDMISRILYRLSWGGADRFLLIFQSFSINSFDVDTEREFVNYLAKNTLNLILPGTPFPESYTPSSQLFPQVIEKNLVGGEIDKRALIISLNTQPYTLFGIFIIIFGFAAPVFLYLFTFIYIFIFNKIDNVFIKITMLYFFVIGLSSFGIEVVLGDSVHLLVSISLMYFLLKIFSQFSIRSLRLRPVKSDRIHSLNPP